MPKASSRSKAKAAPTEDQDDAESSQGAREDVGDTSKKESASSDGPRLDGLNFARHLTSGTVL